MVVNTKTGTLTLTVRERKTLQDALNLVVQLEKHGSDSVSNLADEVGTSMGTLLDALAPVEVTT